MTPTPRFVPPGPWGLGLAQLGNLYTIMPDAIAGEIVGAAWAAGVRYFDTAPHYGLGLSEVRAGELLASYPRSEYVISTKVGRLLVPNSDFRGEMDEHFVVPAATRRRWDFSRDGVLRSIDASLVRLGLDRIDIAYLHDPDDFADQALREALPALNELRSQGILRAIGVGMNQSALPARFIAESDLDLVMLAGRYTLLDQSALKDLLPLALKRGVGVVAAGVYNSGLLAQNRPSSHAKFDYQDAPTEIIKRANRIATICEEYGVSLPVAAMAFPIQHPAVITRIVGCESPDQVRETTARTQTPVPTEVWQRLVAEGLIEPS